MGMFDKQIDIAKQLFQGFSNNPQNRQLADTLKEGARQVAGLTIADIPLSAKEAYDAAQKGDYLNAGLSAAAIIPGIPYMGGITKIGESKVIQATSPLSKEITTKKGNKITLKYDPEEGILFAYNQKGSEVGRVEVAPIFEYDLKNPTSTSWMGVEKEYQRQGINTEMQKMLMDILPNYTPISKTLTDEGVAWAEKVPASFIDRDTKIRALVERMKEQRMNDLNKPFTDPFKDTTR